MIGRFLDPTSGREVEQRVVTADDLLALLDAVEVLRGERGHPALELLSEHGSLVVAPTDAGYVVMWTDSLGHSFHSVGDADAEDLVAFDYLGSYTEVPSSVAVAPQVARDASVAFQRSGAPEHHELLLEPD